MLLLQLLNDFIIEWYKCFLAVIIKVMNLYHLALASPFNKWQRNKKSKQN